MIQNVEPVEVQGEEIVEAFTEIFRREDAPEIVIETGSYTGLGSSLTILQAWAKSDSGKIMDFWTIEANEVFYSQAVQNLRDWPNATVYHGLSLKRDEAEKFIQEDDIIWKRDEKGYEDIRIDFGPEINPVAFYMGEISENVTGDCEEDLLRKLIAKSRGKKVLFFLDSAGGLGKLECEIVLKEMRGRNYFLAWDDSDHLKSLRSAQMARSNHDGRWKVLHDDGRVMITQRKGYRRGIMRNA